MRSMQSVQSRPVDAVSSSRYRLLVELGHGGMANVFLAVQLGSAGFRRLAVLKRLRPALSHDTEFLEMFLQEARLAARLNHPNVVHTHEVGQDEECHFMALEYLQGQSYQTVLQRAGREHYDFAYSVRVLIEALKGLEYAHQLRDFDGTPLQVVHRDISPSNIFITYDGQIKILDFGIAKAMSSSVETKAGMLKGKISYMSPEQASGKPVNAQSDLFAVGVLLWEAAAGKRRWRGLQEVTVLRKMMNGEVPEAPGAVERGLPNLVDELCLRALAPNPEDRFETAAMFREALEHLLAVMGRRVSAEEVGRAVADEFQEDRDKLQRAIEQELVHLQRDEDLTMSSLVQPKSAALGGDRPSTQSRTIAVSPSPSEQARTETEIEARGRRSLWPLALGGVALVVGLGSFFLSRHPELVATTAPSPAPSAAPSVAPAASAKTISVHISASPPQAKLSLDGKQLSSNPYVAELGQSNGSVTVQAQAEGYATQSSVIALDADRTVRLELASLPSSGTTEVIGAAPVARPRTAATRESASSAAAGPVSAPPPAPTPAAPAPAAAAAAAEPENIPKKRPKSSVVLDTDNPWQK